MVQIIKRLIPVVAMVLSLVLLVIISVAIIIASDFKQDIVTIGNYGRDNLPTYRIMVIVNGSNDSYVEALKEGLLEAASEYHVAFELWPIKGENQEEETFKQFDIALESKVDGIIFQPFPNVDYEGLFLKAKDYGIPVLAILTDVPKQEKVSAIIYNRYQIGSELGQIMKGEFAERNIEEGTIIMVYNNQLSLNDEAFGISQELPEEFDIQFVKVDYDGENILNGEELTREIMEQYDDVVTIISTSEQETLGVVQGLKDGDKINDVIIIGFDYSKEIEDFIQRDIMFATVVPDNRKLGYDAMKNMVEYKRGEFVSMYEGISVKILTSENIGDYEAAYDKVEDE